MDSQDLRFFLDSGAYSAWSVGKVVDLDAYCDFITANIEHIDVYACLDVIPGKPGSEATQKERDSAAQQTWENYLYMVSKGCNPLPVYHYGEDVKWLRNMLDHEVTYIGLGGLVGKSSKMRRLWLDRVFTMLTDKDGHPIVRTHGFGMTSVPLIFRYPWYSVDSISWNKITQFGGVCLPRVDGDHEFLFDRTPEVVAVSERSPNQKLDGKHVNSLGPTTREILNKWLAFCGVTLEQVSSNYYFRARCNIMFFKMVSECRKDFVFTHPVGNRGLFF